MFIVYIIYSQKIDRFYTGYTADPEKRLQEHNDGLSAFTAKANDWVIRYQQTFQSREQAQNREREIKKKKSRKYIEWLVQQQYYCSR